MANTIKIKRKPLGNTGESVPSTLTPGELAFNENTQTLYCCIVLNVFIEKM